MWSHVIVPVQVAVLRVARLTGSAYKTFRLHLGGGSADTVPALGGDDFYQDTPENTTSLAPTVGTPYTTPDGTIWFPGTVRNTSGSGPAYFVPKWDSASERMVVGCIAIAPLDRFSENGYSGITSVWAHPTAGIVFVSMASRSGRRTRAVFEWPGSGYAVTGDPAHPQYFFRYTGPRPGADPYSPTALYNQNTVPSFAGPSWSGLPLLIFHQAGQWWIVATGIWIYPDGSGTTREAYALWQASGGDPNQPESWDLITLWSGFDLNASTAPADYGAHSAGGDGANQVLAFGADIFIATQLSRDTATGHTPYDATCIRRMDSGGTLHNDWALPAATLSGATHQHFGCLGTYAGDLYAATMEGWAEVGESPTATATLILWKRDASTGTWASTATLTRTHAAWGSPKIASLLEIGGELIISLDAPNLWGAQSPIQPYALIAWSPLGGWRVDTQIAANTMQGQYDGVLPRLFLG